MNVDRSRRDGTPMDRARWGHSVSFVAVVARQRWVCV
jgi:hypothetical protein